jgi:formylglycine-generating enzyme required for sulfatase activity
MGKAGTWQFTQLFLWGVSAVFPWIWMTAYGDDTNLGVDASLGLEVSTSRWSDAVSDTRLADKEGKYAWSGAWPHEGERKDLGAPAVRIPELLRLAASSPPREMVRIPGGTYVMGVTRFGVTNLTYESPAHMVSIHTIYMDRYECFMLLWSGVQQWAVEHGYTDLPVIQTEKDNDEDDDKLLDHPVVNVSWYDCVKWCNARSEKEGLMPVYYTDNAQMETYRTGSMDLVSALVDWSADGYRLPTEAEWEKAARGGLKGMNFPWGNDVDGGKANYYNSRDDGEQGTMPVGYYDGRQTLNGKQVKVDMVNEYGLYDMAGNVSEWCWDRYASIDLSVISDPTGPDVGNTRVMRGGSWRNALVEHLFVSFRERATPDIKGDYVGFRCVRRE